MPLIASTSTDYLQRMASRAPASVRARVCHPTRRHHPAGLRAHRPLAGSTTRKPLPPFLGTAPIRPQGQIRFIDDLNLRPNPDPDPDTAYSAGPDPVHQRQ